MLKTGEAYDADDVRAYIQARIAGPKPATSRAQKMASLSYSETAVADIEFLTGFLAETDPIAAGNTFA